MASLSNEASQEVDGSSSIAMLTAGGDGLARDVMRD
jgi:hypothetical protein